MLEAEELGEEVTGGEGEAAGDGAEAEAGHHRREKVRT